MKKSKYTYLLKNVFLFSLSSFLPKLLSIILIPIYTSYLTTEEYGISDLITTTVSLAVPIFTLAIQDAVMRFAMDRGHDQKDVFSIALKIILVGTGLIAFGTFILSLFELKGLSNTYLIFFVVMYFFSATNNSVSLFCRAIDKVGVIVVSGILNILVMSGANILFLVGFDWGLEGFLLANALGSAVSLLTCVIGAKIYKFIKIKTSKQTRKEMLKFSFPLIFSCLSWWVNSASDRYVLSWLVGASAVGVFAMAYKLPSIITLFQNVFTQAWSISAIKEFDKDDTDGFIGNTYSTLSCAMVLICSAFMIANYPISKFLFKNDFFTAWKFVPPLLLATVFNCMALFIGSIFVAVKDTKVLSVSTITGAIINLICNFLLIYFYGVYGAAIATLIGNFVVYAIRHIILRKHIRLRIHWGREVAVYLLLLAQMIVGRLNFAYVWIEGILFLGLILLYAKDIKRIFVSLISKIKGEKKEI